jgi:hypothetical protein
MPRSSITGSYGSSFFSFFEESPYCFHNCCTNLHSHQQCIRVPVRLHPHQHFLLLLLLNMAILTAVRWNLSVVLICISFITRDVEHFFMCLLAICTSSFQNFLFNSCARPSISRQIVSHLSHASTPKLLIFISTCYCSDKWKLEIILCLRRTTVVFFSKL